MYIYSDENEKRSKERSNKCRYGIYLVCKHLYMYVII